MHHVKCWGGWITSRNQIISQQDRWDKYQQPQICRWYHPNGRKWRGTKETPDEGEREEWKSWLKTKQLTQKIKTMASGPITSWQIDGEKWKHERLYFLGLQNHCSHKIKRCFLLGRKTMTNLVCHSIVKRRDITLPTKVYLVKVFLSCHVLKVGPQRRLNVKELMLSNCGAGEDSWELLGQQGDQTSQS